MSGSRQCNEHRCVEGADVQSPEHSSVCWNSASVSRHVGLQMLLRSQPDAKATGLVRPWLSLFILPAPFCQCFPVRKARDRPLWSWVDVGQIQYRSFRSHPSALPDLLGSTPPALMSLVDGSVSELQTVMRSPLLPAR